MDKTIIITGAGGGIGGALAKNLLERGAKIVALDRSTDGLRDLAVQVNDPSRLLSLTIDITKKSEVEKLPARTTKTFPHIDGLINCAGIIQPFATVEKTDYAVIEHVMNVNFFGTLYMTKTFLPLLRSRPQAIICNVSSMGGFLPVPGQSIYGASKAGVKLFTEALWAELQASNISVSVVFPGATNTAIVKNSGVTMPIVSADSHRMSAMMLPAEKVAGLIIRGIEKNKLYIYTGKDSRLMSKLYRLNPRRATSLIAKQMRSLLK